MESNHGISLRTAIEYFDNVVSIIGFVLNLTLLYLIIYKTSARLKEYRPILLQNCLIDTFFNITNAVTKGQVEQKNGNFYLYMVGPLANIDVPYNNLIICFWVFSFFYCLTGVPVQFIYRYLMIVKGVKITVTHYFKLLLSAFIPAFTYSLWAVYTFWPNEENWNRAAMLLRADHNYDEGIPSFVVASIDDWPLRILFTYAYVLVSGVYGIIIFSSIKVWRHLKTMESQMSVQAKDAQRQITVTFIFQAIVPCVVSIIPILIAVTMVFIHANVPGVGLIVALLYTIIPVANPLLTLIIIRNYGKNIASMLRKIYGRGNRRVDPTMKSTIYETIHAQEKRIPSLNITQQFS